MEYKIVTDSKAEPIGIDEILVELKIDEDLLTLPELSMLEKHLAASRRHCEKMRGEAFITKTIDAVADCWDNDFALPITPLRSVTSIKYYDCDEVEYDLASSVFFADTYRGIISLKYGQVWPSETLRPANGIIIRYQAGYGDDSEDVPADFRSAITMLVWHLWRNREDSKDNKVLSDMLTRVNDWTIEKMLRVDRDVGI